MRLFIFFILLASSLSAQSVKSKVEVVSYDELRQILYQSDNQLYVVNFWATWCKPCVEELPHFMRVDSEFNSRKDYQMILVSLDFARKKDEILIPFLEKRNIRNDVYILDDNKRMDYWITKTNKDWSGSLPATIFLKNGETLFFTEGILTMKQLRDKIIQNIKKL